MPNIALLSCWNPYHVRSFVRELSEFSEVNIVALWDDDVQRGEAFAEEFETVFQRDLTELLARPYIDGVIIDSSPEQAASLIMQAAQAGKHVLVDQVLAMTLKDAKYIAVVIEHANIHFAIDMSLRRWPVNQGAKQIADSEALGKITSMRIRNAHDSASKSALPPQFAESSYGVFTDLGAHGLYLMLWILGKPTAVTAITTHVMGHKPEDNAAAIFEYSNGAFAICESSYVAEHSPFAIELYGTKGSYLGGGVNGVHRKLLHAEDSSVRIFTNSVDENKLSLPEATESSLTSWIKLIQGEQGTPPPGVNEAIELAEVLEALYLSAHSERKVMLNELN